MERNGVFNPILSRMLGERIHVELKDDGVSVEGEARRLRREDEPNIGGGGRDL